MNFLEIEYRAFTEGPLAPAPKQLIAEATDITSDRLRHGDIPQWQTALDALPTVMPSSVDLNLPAPRLGHSSDLNDEQHQQLRQSLSALHPWRKGPFELFGTALDTEWRSDLKWERLIPHIQPLRSRHILDVGCGNGYYALRMLGAGAASVTGIDPTLRFIAQFGVFRRFYREMNAFVLPLRSEDLPTGLNAFDTVFSMGVIYHRRSPFDHLAELYDALRPGGEVVLETLIVPESFANVLIPEDRYAKMRNVWFIPSAQLLLRWLQRAGFKDGRIVDVSSTKTSEQRRTEWMQFESLSDFLDPDDQNLTVEGYPAPMRAVAVARRP